MCVCRPRVTKYTSCDLTCPPGKGTGRLACTGGIHCPFGSRAKPNASREDFGRRGDTATGEVEPSSNNSTSPTAASINLIKPAFFSNTTNKLSCPLKSVLEEDTISRSREHSLFGDRMEKRRDSILSMLRDEDAEGDRTRTVFDIVC